MVLISIVHAIVHATVVHATVHTQQYTQQWYPPVYNTKNKKEWRTVFDDSSHTNGFHVIGQVIPTQPTH